MSNIVHTANHAGLRLVEEAARKADEISRNPIDQSVGVIGAIVGGIGAACAVAVAAVHAPSAILPILHAAPGLVLAGAAGGLVAGVATSKAVRET